MNSIEFGGIVWDSDILSELISKINNSFSRTFRGWHNIFISNWTEATIVIVYRVDIKKGRTTSVASISLSDYESLVKQKSRAHKLDKLIN